MTLGRLAFRTLVYHWRGNLAVLLGVALGTAVLTGALLVGDSLRGSLRELTLERLGWVDQALVSGRFFHESLVEQIPADWVAAAIILQGSATSRSGAQVHRAPRVTIFGVEANFWPQRAYASPDIWSSDRPEAVPNQALADELNIQPGAEVTVYIQKPSNVPRESLLGRRDTSDVLEEIKLRVRAVIPNSGMGTFALNPSPAVPRNLFLPIGFLQQKLNQQQKINVLLVGTGSSGLQESLHKQLSLDDWGLMLQTPETRMRELFKRLDRNHDGKLTKNEWNRRLAESFLRQADANHDGVLEQKEVQDFYRRNRNYMSLESRQLLLPPAVAEAALAAAKDMQLTAAPTFVYLANSISDGKNEIPYSVVAALDASLPPPLGPFLPPGASSLQDGEIALVKWKESPLQVQPGQNVSLSYFAPEGDAQAKELTVKLRVRGFLEMTGVTDDPDLTPEFPGITDKLDLRDWDPPPPFNAKTIQEHIKPRDERYWQEYRTAPKGYLNLAEGQKLWGSRFGSLTSIRLGYPKAVTRAGSDDISKVGSDYAKRLLAHLSPEQGGFVFDPVRERGLAGSTGSADFGGLFIGFSFFLIVAALLLVGLLYRLNLDRRGPEIGLLSATGYRVGTVHGLLLAEGGLLAVLGGLIGLAAAIGYGWLVLGLFRAWWPGGLDQSFLRFHAEPLSFLIGYAASLVVSLATIGWVVHSLAKLSTPALLAGVTTPPVRPTALAAKRSWSWWIAIFAGGAAVITAALGKFVHDRELQATSFFASGALLLIGGLATVRLWMNQARERGSTRHAKPNLTELGIRNATRYPVRSLLAVSLLAFATFTLVAIESFYKSPGKEIANRDSGSGGYTFLAEADLPIYQNLNSANGLDDLSIPDTDRATFKELSFTPFRLRQGEDVSCLNLYKPSQLRLLGTPSIFIEQGGFRFADSQPNSLEERANPWLLLNKPCEDGAIPVIGDANTVKWILHSGLGQELQTQSDDGEPVRLRVVALLQDSIFQSELLLSERNFLHIFPRHEGYRFFLLHGPPTLTVGPSAGQANDIRAALETALADHGFSVMTTAQRLQSYLAVENTYLLTFQALGGLGLALGALGLGVVLIRTVWERRRELALLRALGFRERALSWLLLAENTLLLMVGLGIGVIAALVAVAPQIVAGAGQVPWSRLAGLLLVVLVVGITAGWLALLSSLRAPILEALRRE